MPLIAGKWFKGNGASPKLAKAFFAALNKIKSYGKFKRFATAWKKLHADKSRLKPTRPMGTGLSAKKVAEAQMLNFLNAMAGVTPNGNGLHEKFVAFVNGTKESFSAFHERQVI